MAHFLFVDESGQDRRESPYEVLAGVLIADRDLWNVILALHDAELRHFGRRYSADRAELKGTKLLKRKTFRLATQARPYNAPERTRLAHECLDHGDEATFPRLTALAQAKLAYVAEVFEICARFRCVAIASIVAPTAYAPQSPEAREDASRALRLDYVDIFERLYCALEDTPDQSSGIVVFDEFEKTQSHLLIGQMHQYFQDTPGGRLRSGRIIPEPFFVHSDLTTGVQLADLVAYVLSWGFRTAEMTEPAREELKPFASQIRSLEYHGARRGGQEGEQIEGFALVRSLHAPW